VVPLDVVRVLLALDVVRVLLALDVVRVLLVATELPPLPQVHTAGPGIVYEVYGLYKSNLMPGSVAL
jgi:hypothetical protein